MKLKSVVAAVVILAGASAASAATLDLGAFVLTYNDSTILGSVSSSSFGSGTASFEWELPTQVAVSGSGTSTLVTNAVTFPSFSLMAKTGFVLTGVGASLGDLNYVESKGNLTAAQVAYDVSLGGPVVFSTSFNLTKTQEGVKGDTVRGIYSGTQVSPAFMTSEYSASNVRLNLSAVGAGTFIYSDTTNRLTINVLTAAAPVPEPETYAMLLAGVGVVAWVARRRRQS